MAYESTAPRRVFKPGTVSERTIQVRLPSGVHDFGYTVDASWVPPGGPVSDAVKDFPISANCMEPYQVLAGVGQGLAYTAYGQATVQVVVYDHQGMSTVSEVKVEAPDIFTGQVELSLSVSPDEFSAIYSGTIHNEKGLETGVYPMLVQVDSLEKDSNLGDVTAWNVVDVHVSNMDGWAKDVGGQSDVWDVITDAANNIYYTGFFYGAVDFDPGPGQVWK